MHRWLSSSDRFLFVRSTYQGSQQHLLPLILEVAELMVARFRVAGPLHAPELVALGYFVASFGRAGRRKLRPQTFGAECGRNRVIVV